MFTSFFIIGVFIWIIIFFFVDFLFFEESPDLQAAPNIETAKRSETITVIFDFFIPLPLLTKNYTFRSSLILSYIDRYGFKV